MVARLPEGWNGDKQVGPLFQMGSMQSSPSLNPDGLAECTVGGNVPHFEAGPFRALEIDIKMEGAAGECAVLAEVHSLAEHPNSVAPDHLGEGGRECPFDARRYFYF